MTDNELRRRVEMAEAGIFLREDGAHEAARQLLLELLHDGRETWHIDAMLCGLRIYSRGRVLQAAGCEERN